MAISTSVPASHPLMRAWNAYRESDEFKNSLIWATVTSYRQAGVERPDGQDAISDVTREQHATGSMWAAFERGFVAGRLAKEITALGTTEREKRAREAWAWIEWYLKEESCLSDLSGANRLNCINAILNTLPDSAYVAAAVEFLRAGESLHKVRAKGEMLTRKQVASLLSLCMPEVPQ